MPEYDRIDIPEGIDNKKANASKECKICHYWYFKDIGFKYKPYLCTSCHGLMQNVAIVYVKESAYRINFWYMSKYEAINTMNNSNLIDEIGVLWFFYLHVKISNTTYYERNRDVILNRVKYYYKNNKIKDKYRNLSEENKKKEREHGKNRYHNMFEEKKTKTKIISKNLSRGWKGSI